MNQQQRQSEIQIDLKLTVKIPQEGMKINNLLLRKFMPQLFWNTASDIPCGRGKGHCRAEKGISSAIGEGEIELVCHLVKEVDRILGTDISTLLRQVQVFARCNWLESQGKFPTGS